MDDTNVSHMKETVFMKTLWNALQTQMAADAQLRQGEAVLHETKRGTWFIACEKEGEERRYWSTLLQLQMTEI